MKKTPVAATNAGVPRDGSTTSQVIAMLMRRFTRLTNGFSKKLENHIAAVSLHFMYYNFCCIHMTLRVTPAMAAGVTDRLWEIGDIVRLLEEREGRIAAEERAEKLKSVYRHVLPSNYE